MTINVLSDSILEKARYYGSQLRTHLRISPLNLGLVIVPVLLIATMASVDRAPVSTAEDTQGMQLVPSEIEHKTPENRHFQGAFISFSYPSDWRVDSTRSQPREVVLEVPDAVKSSSIRIQALNEPSDNLAQLAIESVEKNDDYKRYFLRRSSDYFVKHEPVVNLHYTAVTNDDVSIRGLKMAFTGSDGTSYILDLRTQFPNSLGNDLQVKKIAPYCLDLINTMK